MKTVKSIVVLSFLILGSISFAQAQAGGGLRGGQQGGRQGPPPIPDESAIVEMVSDLADKISLSEEQEFNVLTLYQAHFAQIKATTSSDSRPNREEMEAIKTAFEDQVRAELTEEQIVKYNALQKKQASRKSKR